MSIKAMATHKEVENLFRLLNIHSLENPSDLESQNAKNIDFGDFFFGVKDETISSSETLSYDISVVTSF